MPPPAANYPPGAAPVPAYPAPPTFDPTLAQQFSVPPVSAYPYPYGIPSAVPAPPATSGHGRAGLIVLSVLVALLVGASGVMTTLFLLQKHETSKANNQITALAGQVGSLTSSNDQLQKDLDKTKGDLKDAQDTNDQTSQDKQVLIDCLKALDAEFAAIDKANGQITAAVQRAINDADTKCRKASQFL
jgi:hypothetical protein